MYMYFQKKIIRTRRTMPRPELGHGRVKLEPCDVKLEPCDVKLESVKLEHCDPPTTKLNIEDFYKGLPQPCQKCNNLSAQIEDVNFLFFIYV